MSVSQVKSVMKGFRRAAAAPAAAGGPPSLSSFDFDLGLDIDAKASSTPWKLEEIVARAGEEADQHFMEATLDHSIAAASDDPESNLLLLVDGGGDEESWGTRSSPQSRRALDSSSSSLIAKKRRPTAHGPLSAAGKLRQVSQELSQELKAEMRKLSANLGIGNTVDGSSHGSSRAAMLMKRKKKVLARSISGTQYALQGLQFISKATGNAHASDDLWKGVETRFHQLAVDGLLAREDFGYCIGKLKHASERETETETMIKR